MPIPAQLRERAQWLIWRFEKKEGQEKLAKVPYYAGGGRRAGKQGDEKDRARLVTFDAAIAASPKTGSAPGCGGVGFAFLPGDGLIGIDLDGMIDTSTGEISKRGDDIIKACDSFTEYSPSGKGVHIYVQGETKTFKRNEIGVEVFCGAQFFTVTGNHYSGTPLEVRPISDKVLRRLLITVKGKPAAPSSPAPAPASGGDDFKRVNDAAMRNLGAWVPALFPTAKVAPNGYRVPQKDLGRDLQEDLSITEQGIVDWGVHDQGDRREGRRTPIDLVIEWSSAKKPAEALHWLADKVGIALEKPKRTRKKAGGGAGEPPAQGGQGGDDATPGLPTIRWVQGKLPECVDQAEDALLKAGIRIYQRAGYLVRVVRRDTPSVRHYKRPPGALGILTVDAPYLIESFTRAARWEKWNARTECWTRSNAPEQAAATYIARRGHWQLPRLWSAISAPTLRPDGTVLQTPGYDAATQSWYDPCGIEFPRIADSPTQEDAENALETFKTAFESFPFETSADRSVAMALALTALVRRSLPSAPLGGITAPVMASGKTLLADCIAILATGVSAPAMKYADTDEEATKTMLAVLAEGDQVVLIDNVERPLQGDTLCAVLTSETYRQRMLGRTEMMSVPTTTLFLATGNHLVISGDLRTRALLCRIDPEEEHPEQRQFPVELREWVTQRRPEIVAAGLTLLRAFIATEQDPKKFCKTWGRFERWSDMVRAPLIWLKCEDPCVTLEDLEKEDPERAELLRTLSAWSECFKKEPVTAREAVELASKASEMDPPARALDLALREICKDRDGSLNPKKLGHWLRAHADRLTEGRRFVRAGEKDHTALWKVEAMS